MKGIYSMNVKWNFKEKKCKWNFIIELMKLNIRLRAKVLTDKWKVLTGKEMIEMKPIRWFLII